MSGVIYPVNNKKYTAEDVEIFNCTRTSGVYTVLDFDCSLNGNVVTIGKGLAWIKNGDFTGKALAFKEPETLTLDGADSTNNRYDVVAVRYDASKAEPELVVIKGEAEAEPVIPTRSKETYLYELFLYAILRKAGESSASIENLIDLRTNETFCGLMRDSVTSAVVPAYDTIFDIIEFNSPSLYSGATLDFDYEKYQYLIADVGNTIASCGIVLPLQTGSVTSFFFSGSNFCVKQQQIGEPVTIYFRMQVDLTENSDRGHVITLLEWSSTPDFSSKQNARLDRLVGITKQPEGYVKVDDIYNPESHNAQSGEAVKQAIDEALEGFEGGGSGLTKEQITALDNMFKISAFTENPTNAYNSFKEAFGIVDDDTNNDNTNTDENIEWKKVWEFTDEDGEDPSTVFTISNQNTNNTAALTTDGFCLASVNSTVVAVNCPEAKNVNSAIIEVEARIDVMGTYDGGFGFRMNTGTTNNYAKMTTGNNKIFQSVGTAHNEIGTVSADGVFHTYRVQNINGVYKICFDGIDLTGDYTNGCTDGYGGSTAVMCHFGATATIRAIRVWYE